MRHEPAPPTERRGRIRDTAPWGSPRRPKEFDDRRGGHDRRSVTDPGRRKSFLQAVVDLVSTTTSTPGHGHRSREVEVEGPPRVKDATGIAPVVSRFVKIRRDHPRDWHVSPRPTGCLRGRRARPGPGSLRSWDRTQKSPARSRHSLLTASEKDETTPTRSRAGVVSLRYAMRRA